MKVLTLLLLAAVCAPAYSLELVGADRTWIEDICLHSLKDHPLSWTDPGAGGWMRSDSLDISITPSADGRCIMVRLPGDMIIKFESRAVREMWEIRSANVTLQREGRDREAVQDWIYDHLRGFK